MTGPSFQAIFKFVAKNPASILILGGLLGLLVTSATQGQSVAGWWTLILLGTAVHVVWLLRRNPMGR